MSENMDHGSIATCTWLDCHRVSREAIRVWFCIGGPRDATSRAPRAMQTSLLCIISCCCIISIIIIIIIIIISIITSSSSSSIIILLSLSLLLSSSLSLSFCDGRCEQVPHLGVRHSARCAVPNARGSCAHAAQLCLFLRPASAFSGRPISVLRFWISEALTQAES